MAILENLFCKEMTIAEILTAVGILIQKEVDFTLEFTTGTPRDVPIAIITIFINANLSFNISIRLRK